MCKDVCVPTLLALLVLTLCGCESGARDLRVTSERDKGSVGIPFRNGVECLGEEAQPIAGETVYVSPQGDDGNAGDSPDAPLGTLAYALCNLRPGQTLYVLPGTYRESVILGAFGEAGAPITIRGLGGEEQRPVLDGENIRTVGIALVESLNITIEGLEIRNYTDEGVYVLDGHHIVLRDNRFIANGRASTDPDMDGEGFGLAVIGGREVLIEDNEAAFNGPNRERWENYILGMGINTFELFDSVIRGNDVHDTIGGGILVEDGGNVLVEGNRIHHNELDANGDYWDGGIWVDGSRQVTLRGNPITENHGPGLNLSDEDVRYPEASIGTLVEENVITGNLFGVYTWNFGQCPVPEDAIRFAENRVEDNAERDFWCMRWACGEGRACE